MFFRISVVSFKTCFDVYERFALTKFYQRKGEIIEKIVVAIIS